MADENKPPQFGAPHQYKWIAARNGVINQIYCNYAHPSWTLFDVSLRLGQLIPDDAARSFVVEERTTVTFSWAQAKFLRELLTRLVSAYEEVNGEIQPIKLAPDKTIQTGDAGANPKAGDA